MNALLGSIQLGAWELGGLDTAFPTTGTCSGAANPTRNSIFAGGLEEPLSSVPGTICFGLFQLGQVPGVNIATPPGTYRALGDGNPVRVAVPSPVPASCSGSGSPIRLALGNKGALLAVGNGNPIRAAAGTMYYATMTAEGDGDPERTATGTEPAAAVGVADPERVVSLLIGQPVSCVVGPNTPVAEVSNYAY